MTKAYEILSSIPGSVDDLPNHLDERRMIVWNYLFRNNPSLGGTFTIRAKTKADATKKIKKEWGLTDPVEGLFVWSE